jgi:CRISPR-associated protein Cmr2
VDDSIGTLIYSGGDDVLAMVPAANAIACAEGIRNRFRELFIESNPEKYNDMDASAGIAIAHFKAPLQDVVKAAQVAEKRAKRKPEDGGLGRGAVAVTLFKRSGEILEWGTKWEGKGKELLDNLIENLINKNLNKRFPHKLEALLTPYLPQSQSIDTNQDFETHFSEIIELEINHCLSRNAGGVLDGDSISLFSAYWEELNRLKNTSFAKKLTLFINLLRTAAWMTRNTESDEDNKNSED